MMSKYDFTKKVEKMIDPIEVGNIHFMHSYMEKIPVKIQKKMMHHGAKKSPYMGFVVEPYSFFICYEITDVASANRLLPDDYEIVKTKIFTDDIEAKPYCIFGSFNVHTSAFWGSRMECSIIAENKKTGLQSWVIVDYSTNTVRFDEHDGLNGGNVNHCVVTTDYDGEVIVDIEGENKVNVLRFQSDITEGNQKILHPQLWLDGNLSVAYGRVLSNNTQTPFSVIFNPKEVEQARDIPLKNLKIEQNTWHSEILSPEPLRAVCFPFAQHFLADSPGHYSHLSNRDELSDKVNHLSVKPIPNYSSKPLKKAMYYGQIFSFVSIVLLMILFIRK